MKLLDSARNRIRKIVPKHIHKPSDASHCCESSDAAHPCLFIDEILQKIVEYVYDDANDRSSVAAVALTCKAFTDVANSYLWSELPGIDPLRRLYGMVLSDWTIQHKPFFSESDVEGNDEYETSMNQFFLSRVPLPQEIWKQCRWIGHAKHVRRLRWGHLYKVTAFILVLRTTIDLDAGESLLPNLQWLHFAGGEEAHLEYVKYLLGPAIKSVTIDASAVFPRLKQVPNFDPLPDAQQLRHEATWTILREYGTMLSTVLYQLVLHNRPLESLTLHVNSGINYHLPTEDPDYRRQLLTCNTPFWAALIAQRFALVPLLATRQLTHFSNAGPLKDESISTLSRMPNLRSLELFSRSTQKPIERESPATSFPALTSLRLTLECANHDMLAFVQSLGAPALQKLTIQLHCRSTDPQDIGTEVLRCLTQAEYRNTLQSLSLRGSIDTDAQNATGYPTLEPLLENPFPNLTYLHVLDPFLTISDQFLSDLGSRYPFLEDVRLCRSVTHVGEEYDQTLPTFDGLYSLVQSCPNLHTLWLAVQLSVSTQSLSYTPCTNLRRWCVLCSPNPRCGGDLISEFLHKIFPNLEEVVPNTPLNRILPQFGYRLARILELDARAFLWCRINETFNRQCHGPSSALEDASSDSISTAISGQNDRTIIVYYVL